MARTLTSQLPVLDAPPQPGYPLPRAALDALGEWRSQLDAIVEDGARFWGGEERVDFWAVPVVVGGAKRCAPANRACVVAVTESERAYAACGLRARDVGGESWVVAQIRPGHAAIWGTVPSSVTAAFVTIDGATARAEAGNGVVGGVLPVPYRDRSKVSVALIPGPEAAPPPAIGVVDASGILGVAENVRARIRRAGYATVLGGRTARERQPRTVVYWWPDGTSLDEAQRVARLLRADLRRIEPDEVPGAVLETPAPVVVAVGSEP